MTVSANARLSAAVSGRQSNLCVGLDPVAGPLRGLFAPELGGECNDAAAMPDRQVCAAASRLVMQACLPYAAAFKPNAAFFEPDLSDAYALATDAASCGANAPIMILDAKRGDIGNTSGAYARSILAGGGFDFVTVNPLMGHDCVGPFLSDPTRGVFLLCLTSNPGAEDFLLKHDLYKRIAEKAVEWNGNDNVGLVVGATRPEYAASIRAIAPHLPLLIPGVGAQGGSLEETLDAIDARRNRRFVINVSRAVMFAPATPGERQADAAARAARELRDSIGALL